MLLISPPYLWAALCKTPEFAINWGLPRLEICGKVLWWICRSAMNFEDVGGDSCHKNKKNQGMHSQVACEPLWFQLRFRETIMAPTPTPVSVPGKISQRGGSTPGKCTGSGGSGFRYPKCDRSKEKYYIFRKLRPENGLRSKMYAAIGSFSANGDHPFFFRYFSFKSCFHSIPFQKKLNIMCSFQILLILLNFTS